MGQFLYGSPPDWVEMDDRMLAHVRAVVVAKLRRSESFAISFEFGPAEGSGHTTMWLAPSIPVQFKFAGGKLPAVNRTWLDELMTSANSPDGLRMVVEPTPAERPAPAASVPVHRGGLGGR